VPPIILGMEREDKYGYAIVPAMLVGLVGIALLVALVVLDWVQFTSLSAAASRYGCGVARVQDVLPLTPVSVVFSRFDDHGVLTMTHGIARCVREQQEILLRPQYRMLSQRFRTAWPLKASIEVQTAAEATRLICTKRMPWSSAVITLLWFVLVAGGTIGYLVSFLLTGGLVSLGGALMGLGVVGLGLLVLLFGLVVVTLAYRLEDQRLTHAYQELRAVLSSGSSP
jgi:hypothetical protein